MSVIDNATCTFCGCLCDDISVEVEHGRISGIKRVCANGRGVFAEHCGDLRRPTIDGREVEFEEAVAEAAQILEAADMPLIYGLSSSASEGQRKAVELADVAGAVVDTTSSVCHGPTGLALQEIGEPSCTLGEVRNRADLVVFWGCNPSASHIRHFGRYSVMAKGTLTPRGRKDRTVYAVDVRPTGTSKIADHFLQLRVGSDYEVLSTLRLLVRGEPVQAERVGGVAVANLEELAERMKTCRFGVVFMGMGLTMSPGRNVNVAELFTLVAELNDYARFCVIPMRGHGNVAGGDQVLTWLSGYPFAVSYARGYPQFGPGEYTAVDMLARKEADAALILASDPVAHFPRAAAEHLAAIPTILLDPCENLTAGVARVVFPTATYGVDAPGTAYRMDNVPIRLRPVVATERPTDEEVLEGIIAALKRGRVEAEVVT